MKRDAEVGMGWCAFGKELCGPSSGCRAAPSRQQPTQVREDAIRPFGGINAQRK